MDPDSDKKAMEGRQVGTDGRELGDADFHAKGYDFTPEKEQEALDGIAEQEIALEEQQVKSIAENSAELGVNGYRQLINRHPDDPRVDAWRKAINRLESGNAE